jgi:hypothetical protein
VAWRRKSAGLPNSSSSQFFIGVTSMATEGPKLFAPSPVDGTEGSGPYLNYRKLLFLLD